MCAGPRRTSGEFAGAYNSYSEVPMKYRIALHKSEEGYSVSVPGLPGCWSQGATEQEALENIREAIREYLSVVNERSEEHTSELQSPCNLVCRLLLEKK